MDERIVENIKKHQGRTMKAECKVCGYAGLFGIKGSVRPAMDLFFAASLFISASAFGLLAIDIYERIFGVANFWLLAILYVLYIIAVFMNVREIYREINTNVLYCPCCEGESTKEPPKGGSDG